MAECKFSRPQAELMFIIDGIKLT